MRPIDCDPLVEHLVSAIDATYNPVAIALYGAVVKSLADAPTIGPVIAWTPVEKGMPEISYTYLVTTCDGEVCSAYRNRALHWISDDNGNITEMVAAWAPMPAPYKAVSM